MIALGTALYSHLTGGTALMALLASGTASVFYGQASPGARPPYVVFKVNSDTNEHVYPGETRVFVVDVKGIATSGYAATQIGDAIDARMKSDIGAVSGFGLFRQDREVGIEYQEAGDGQTFWHDGGRFRITLSDRV
jgi:protease II